MKKPHSADLRLFYAARRILKEKLDGEATITLKAWKQEYAQLKTEYAELSPQHKPLREEVIRLGRCKRRDTALRRRNSQRTYRERNTIWNYDFGGETILYYSQEQIDRANQTNMEDFLRSQGKPSYAAERNTAGNTMTA